MNKKLLMVISLMVLVGVVGFVSAQENKQIVKIEKGWNLVSGISNVYQIYDDSDITSSNIKVIYAYFAPAQQYIRLHPEPQEEELDSLESIFNTDDDIVAYSAKWIYSDKEGFLRYNQDTPSKYGVKSLSDFQVFKGWNFMPITEDMIESKENSIFSLKDLAGTCDIQKSYVWDVDKQKWLAAPLDSFDFGTDGVGLGWVIKVSNNCNLGKLSNGGINPPSIPN